MQLLILKAPNANAMWLTRLAETMGWPPDAELSGNVSLLNLEALDALQSTWFHVDNLPLGGDRPELPYPLRKKIEACAADANRLDHWLCEDPAMCVLLPYWQEPLGNSLCLIHVEHPLDVALRLRDDWRFPLAFGVALWEYYMRAALISTDGLQRIIVSPRIFAGSGEAALRALRRQLAPLSPSTCPNDAAIARIAAMIPSVVSDQDPERAAFLHASQHAFYQALNAGAVDNIEPGRISAESRDILRFHGRLRAGFDLVRKDRDALRRQLAAEPLPSHLNAAPDEADARETAPPDAANDTDLVEATIHLRGMEPLHLSCAHDNPMLDQLIQALGRAQDPRARDEVIYLEMGETTLYLPVSQLLAVETNGGVTDAGSRPTTPEAQPEQGGPRTLAADAPRTRKSVAVLVLGCLLPQYERCLDVIESTWASRRLDGIDIHIAVGAHLDPTTVSENGVCKYLAGGAPALAAFESRRIGNVIACGCADTIALQGDCLLRKRLIAFNHLAREGKYDYVYTVCASSYVDQVGLRDYIDSVGGEMLFHGPVGVCQFTGRPYVSGASMLLSIDLVQRLAQDAYRILEDNGGRYADDVALGSWIARHVSDAGEERIVENIRAGRRATGDNTFVMPDPPGMIDYVGAEPARQVRVEGAHHYHFGSGTIEHMSAFHHRYFE